PVEALAAPRKVRAAVERALDPVPERRFPSAAAMLAAIEAARQPRSRRRTQIAVLAAIPALAAGAVAWQAPTLPQTLQPARRAAAVGQTAQAIEAALRYAYLQPLHDVRSDEANARAKMRTLAARVASLGDVGQGAGELAAGQGYLGLRDGAAARRYLEAAW